MALERDDVAELARRRWSPGGRTAVMPGSAAASAGRASRARARGPAAAPGPAASASISTTDTRYGAVGRYFACSADHSLRDLLRAHGLGHDLDLLGLAAQVRAPEVGREAVAAIALRSSTGISCRSCMPYAEQDLRLERRCGPYAVSR